MRDPDESERVFGSSFILPRRSLAFVALIALCVACSAVAVAQSISLVAGNGSGLSSGDGGLAVNAGLGTPSGIAVDAAGNLFVAELQPGWRVRKITPAGIISTVAGNGLPGNDGSSKIGDGGLATAAAIAPRSVAVDAAGNLYVFDLYHGRIRKVSPGGTITTFAGGGNSTADGVLATSANLGGAVEGMAFDAGGNLLLTSGQRVRRISTNGIITTVANQANVLAGPNEVNDPTYAGDGGAALAATFRVPRGIAVAEGNIFIADDQTMRIRRIGTDGIIRTVAGGGNFRFDPVATKVDFWLPQGVAADSRGNIVFTTRSQVWQMSRTGILRLVAGYFCDSVYADPCPLNPAPLVDVIGRGEWEFGSPVIDAQGGVYFLEKLDGRVYKVTSLTDPPTPPGLGAFEPYLAVPIDGQTNAVRIADVTGDGRNDVVVLTQTTYNGYTGPRPDDNTLLVFVQKPDGSLAPPTKNKFDNGFSALGVFDFNRDGIRDIVVGTLDQDRNYSGMLIFDGTPSAAFVGRAIATGGLHGQLFDTDIDHDGLVDIVAYGNLPGPVMVTGLFVLRGNGAGGIFDSSFIRAKAQGRVARGDFNSDGLDDFVVAQGDAIELIPQLPTGGFGAHQFLRSPGLYACCNSAVAADVNHDGRQDLVLTGKGNAPVWLYSYIQDSNGKLEGPRMQFVYDIPGPMAAGDINGDGRDDIVMMHEAWRSIGYLEQTPAGMAAETKYLMPRYTSIFDTALGLAIGDVDSDGCKDVAVADYNWGLVLHYGQNCLTAAKPASDLDGDKRSDLVWRSATGTAHAWLGGVASSAVPLAKEAGWTLGAVGDFDRDGRDDLFWRNCVNGLNKIRPGGKARDRAAVTVSNRAWQIAGSGDLDGDGADDLVWRRSAAPVVTTWPAGDGRRERSLGAPPGAQWVLAGIADFDGDGRSDLFWRQTRSGETRFWPGGDKRRAWRGATVRDLDWLPVGSGDLDGNGKDDLLWRNQRDGSNLVWRDGQYARRQLLSVLPDTAWHVLAIADYDGDHRADIYWHHARSGANRIWKGGNADTPMQPGNGPGVQSPIASGPACAAPTRVVAPARVAAPPRR